MASNFQNTLLPYLSLLIFVTLLNPKLIDACFPQIFSFGDSHTDTGNKLQALGDKYHYMRYPPYGETYFGHPTGRFSDGRLIVDFLAQEYGLALIPAYLKGQTTNDNFACGANFAEAGATAVEDSFYIEKGIQADALDFSLDIQLNWFKQLLASNFNSSGSSYEIVSKSLILLGEIGGNDYNGALLLEGRSVDEVRTFPPLVIQRIGETIQELIGLGAKTIIVPGNFPMGCVPAYLTLFRTEREEDYEPDTGCLKWLNNFAKHHNRLLNQELNKLRIINPDVLIIYADYFGALMDINRHPQKYGFEHHLKVCCGGKGPYNYDASISCGAKGSTLCANSSTYVSWDGVHLTEAAYKVLTNGILNGPYAYPTPLSNVCQGTGGEFANILNPSTKYSA